jgi:Binding-protein-dependent transport system inner membrane component
VTCYPARWLLNALRGIDSFVFALLFVAAVELGPFAGALGVAFHSSGSIAKLWAEILETMERGPLEAATLTGANRLKIAAYALLPDALPGLASIVLYLWEFNVRSSTVLGVVGAGGIGQELKNSVRPAAFPARPRHPPHHPRDGHRDRPGERVAPPPSGVMSAGAIRVRGLTKRYGATAALGEGQSRQAWPCS